jgi:hypothetical protein
MLEKNLAQLFSEFDMGTPPSFDKEGYVDFFFLSFPIQLRKLEEGVFLSAPIHPLPSNDTESFLTYAMKGNFLGQGTGGAVIGLKNDETTLTLSLHLPYEMNYTEFKENLEQFVNYIDYWKKETARYEAQRLE